MQNSDSSAAAKSLPVRPLKVLLVDDCLESIRLMSHILDQYKCDITMAFDGEDSIPLLVKEDFDLIILDWQMPLMTGKEMLLMMDRLLNEHRISKNKASTPVVIYSAHDESELEVPKCRHFHYLGFINKQKVYSTMMRDFNYIIRTL